MQGSPLLRAWVVHQSRFAKRRIARYDYKKDYASHFSRRTTTAWAWTHFEILTVNDGKCAINRN